MKKLVLLYCFTAMTCALQAQTLYVPNGTSGIGSNTQNSNVGIGTSTPDRPLEIYSETSVAPIRMTSNRTGGADSYLEYKNKSSVHPSTRVVLGRWGSMNGRFSISLGDGTANPQERFSLTKEGNVGIGEISPLARLHVKSLPDEDAARFEYHNSSLSLTSRAVFRGHGFTSYSAYDGGGGEPRFVLARARGSIDKTTPVSVGDNLGALYWSPSNDKGTFNHAARIHATAVGAQTNGITPAKIEFSTTAMGSANAFPTVRMTINHDGHVGIGTTKTDGFQLSVAGKIRAEEVKVYTGWADFVFDDDYMLRPLADVEAFIKEKGHLPDVPSEAEVLENGIEVGAMNATLLQKIEELTLYTLEQEKKIAARDTLLEQLIRRVEKLEEAPGSLE